MPVLIRTIPSFPGYFSAGQSITVLRRIRGRYCFFYTGHIFVSRLLSWDLLLHGKFNKKKLFFPSDKKWHTLAHIWNPVVKENPESSIYLWQLTRLWIRIEDSRPRESFFLNCDFPAWLRPRPTAFPACRAEPAIARWNPETAEPIISSSCEVIRAIGHATLFAWNIGSRPAIIEWDNHQPIIRLKFWSQYIMLCSCYWWWLSFAFDYHGQI